MLFNEYKGLCPTGKIDYGEWVSSPEGFREQYKLSLQKKEKIEGRFNRGLLSEPRINSLGEEYAGLISENLNLDLVPVFLFNHPQVLGALYSERFDDFCFRVSDVRIASFLIDKKVPQEQLIAILKAKEGLIAPPQGLSDMAQLLDNNEAISAESKIELICDNTYSANYASLVFLKLNSLEPAVVDFMMSQDISAGFAHNKGYRKALLRNSMLTCDHLISALRNSGDDLSFIIGRLLNEHSISERVVKEVAVKAIESDGCCRVPSASVRVDRVIAEIVSEQESYSDTELGIMTTR